MTATDVKFLAARAEIDAAHAKKLAADLHQQAAEALAAAKTADVKLVAADAAAREAAEVYALAKSAVADADAQAAAAEHHASAAAHEAERWRDLADGAPAEARDLRVPLWDVHVSVHCVRPTGKGAGVRKFDLKALLEELCGSIREQDETVKRRTEAVERVGGVVRALERELADTVAREAAQKRALREAEERKRRLAAEKTHVVAQARDNPSGLGRPPTTMQVRDFWDWTGLDFARTGRDWTGLDWTCSITGLDWTGRIMLDRTWLGLAGLGWAWAGLGWTCLHWA